MFPGSSFKKGQLIPMRKGMRILLTLSFCFAVIASLAIAFLASGFSFSAHAASPSYVKSGDGKQKTITATITWYGFNDNSGETEDQHGSADIAYPKSDGYPTPHNHATEGKGTY